MHIFYDEMKVYEAKPVAYENGKFVPQPTRFWILDKKLHSAISRLEEKGEISRWEEFISNDERLFEFFIKLHQKEIEYRKEFLKGRKYPDYVIKKLLTTGIGGIASYDRKPFKVKCLHLWTAYHLGNPQFKNPIGEYVIRKISK